MAPGGAEQRLGHGIDGLKVISMTKQHNTAEQDPDPTAKGRWGQDLDLDHLAVDLRAGCRFHAR